MGLNGDFLWDLKDGFFRSLDLLMIFADKCGDFRGFDGNGF